MHRAMAHVALKSSGGPVDPELRVTLNFHPDRLASGVPILEALARDGVYRSQFETGTSNGGLTAFEGGDRWWWESRRPETLARTTFCYPDSFLEPEDFGIASAMSLIALAEADDQDPLDDYIEAQVHGPVRLEADVEALVLDPGFRGTSVEQAARRLGCPVEWHGGFRLSTAELRRYPDFRGPEYVRLGTALAEDGQLDPRIIGDASRTGRYDDQDLKRVWHYVARFGSPEMA
jgi:Protein of unknown function (DUF3626)